MSDLDQKSPLFPKISVVMAVFNGEKYLREAVDSILSQTFTNFEFIIVDDGSTDSTKDILDIYSSCDSRFVIISRENRGLSASLNEGIAVARGHWIARMDADDISLPERFERQIEHLEKTGADICGSWVKYFGDIDNQILMHASSDDAIKTELLFCCAFAHPTVLMRADKIKLLSQPYSELMIAAEDYELWVRLACAGWRMTNIPKVLLLYRIHKSQTSNNKLLIQKSNTQKNRQDYWGSISELMNLDKDKVESVLKLFAPSVKKVNLSDSDFIFTQILCNASLEAREIILMRLSRLYCGLGALGFCVPLQWYRLNKTFGNSHGVGNLIQLSLLATFRINADSKFFELLKRIYKKIKK